MGVQRELMELIRCKNLSPLHAEALDARRMPSAATILAKGIEIVLISISVYNRHYFDNISVNRPHEVESNANDTGPTQVEKHRTRSHGRKVSYDRSRLRIGDE